ncbi:MAG: hypothetical protein WA998_03905 [Gordonia sp. (in: high G+C Gram-positive bacteria)]
MLSSLGRLSVSVATVAAAVATVVVLAAPVASADSPTHPRPNDPAASQSQAPHAQPSKSNAPKATETDPDAAEASFPMPVQPGALGYLATRSATLWLHQRGAVNVIANLPVPGAYAKSNKYMAKELDRQLTAAVKTPGACLQIIVSGGDGGGLFNYGFFAIEKQYCPK